MLVMINDREPPCSLEIVYVHRMVQKLRNICYNSLNKAEYFPLCCEKLSSCSPWTFAYTVLQLSSLSCVHMLPRILFLIFLKALVRRPLTSSTFLLARVFHIHL